MKFKQNDKVTILEQGKYFGKKVLIERHNERGYVLDIGANESIRIKEKDLELSNTLKGLTVGDEIYREKDEKTMEYMTIYERLSQSVLVYRGSVMTWFTINQIEKTDWKVKGAVEVEDMRVCIGFGDKNTLSTKFDHHTHQITPEDKKAIEAIINKGKDV